MQPQVRSVGATAFDFDPAADPTCMARPLVAEGGSVHRATVLSCICVLAASCSGTLRKGVRPEESELFKDDSTLQNVAGTCAEKVGNDVAAANQKLILKDTLGLVGASLGAGGVVVATVAQVYTAASPPQVDPRDATVTRTELQQVVFVTGIVAGVVGAVGSVVGVAAGMVQNPEIPGQAADARSLQWDAGKKVAAQIATHPAAKGELTSYAIARFTDCGSPGPAPSTIPPFPKVIQTFHNESAAAAGSLESPLKPAMAPEPETPGAPGS